MHAPRLVVFDLDLTLWVCGGTWIDCCQPPFTKDAQGVCRDGGGGVCKLYPDCLSILDHCQKNHLPMAIASRTQQPIWAKQLLDLMGLTDRFAGMEIYPGSKTRHLLRLSQQLNVPIEAILFFDDEIRNIHDANGMGATAIHTPDGLDWPTFEEALQTFAQQTETPETSDPGHPD